MKLMPDRRRIGTILIFLGYRFQQMEKQITKFIIPASIIFAYSIFIILSFSVNINFDFCEKGI